ncbi:MAG: O-methyltransferase [Bacteroidia bacterium]|nr:O-methyltransferase [Bacteroidia bacterium]
MLPETRIEAYAAAHSDPEPPLLAALARETRLKTLYPQMLSGAHQGRLLALLSRLVQPRFVLEVGTFTGYSALCLAEGLAPGGTLVTLEANPEFSALARRYWDASPYGHAIHQVVGDALKTLPSLPHVWDLVFIDARKESYLDYYQAILPQVRPGGLVLTDNVLWSGKVVDKSPTDPAARALHAFNTFVSTDPRVDTVVLPLRDGLTLLRKR